MILVDNRLRPLAATGPRPASLWISIYQLDFLIFRFGLLRFRQTKFSHRETEQRDRFTYLCEGFGTLCSDLLRNFLGQRLAPYCRSPV